MIVAPVRAVLQPLVKGLGDLEPVSLRVGDEVPLTGIVERLVAAAYIRTDLVERRGEFAVRGGILDVFPPTEEHPLRVELFGDEVEEIRWFAVADQRSLQLAPDGLWAPPCREVLLTDAVRERAAALAGQLPGVADLLGKVAEGIAVEGMESLAPALVDGMEPLLDVLPAGCQVVVTDPERVRTRAHDLVATSAEFLQASWINAAAGSGQGQGPGRPRAGAGHRVVLDAGGGPRAGHASWAWTGGRSGRSAPTPSWRPTDADSPDVAGRWTCARSRATAARPSGPWATSAAGCATAGGSWSSPRATVWPSGSSSCSASTSSPPGSRSTACPVSPSPAWCTP